MIQTLNWPTNTNRSTSVIPWVVWLAVDQRHVQWQKVVISDVLLLSKGKLIYFSLMAGRIKYVWQVAPRILNSYCFFNSYCCCFFLKNNNNAFQSQYTQNTVYINLQMLLKFILIRNWLRCVAARQCNLYTYKECTYQWLLLKTLMKILSIFFI